MEWIIIILLVGNIIFSIITICLLNKKKKINVQDDLSSTVVNFLSDRTEKLYAKLASAIYEYQNKIDILVKENKEFRENQIKNNTDSINILNQNDRNLNNLLKEFINKQLTDFQKQKEEIIAKLQTEVDKFSKQTTEKLFEFSRIMKETIEILTKNVEKNLIEIREDNSKKLDLINESVNSKLQKTLEDKLKDSFENVIKQISNVNTAVGEIKGLAGDVSSLKNVLANVKTKGIIGEVILGNLIRDFLTVNQYEENFATKVGSKEKVEFAIKLPGNENGCIYLPVDSKFPYEPYSKIIGGKSVDEINDAKKLLRQELLKYAKDVATKYIDVPNTTDFAIIFLPLESLYLETLSMGLFEELQTKYKINLCGPTTFTAFITSLQVGFKSIMIEKKSAEIFKLLGAVKTEFAKFAEALAKTQKKFNETANELDSLVGTRTRMLNSKLKNIESLDEINTVNYLKNDE